MNVGGTQHAAELGAPLVVLLDRLRLRRDEAHAVRRVRCAEPAVGVRTHEAARRGGGGRGRVDRAHVVALRLDGQQLRAHDARGSARSATRSRSSTTSAARPTFVGHLAEAVHELVELPRGLWHLAADGDCTWAEFAEAIFEDAGLDCRVRRITTAELGRPAPRPAYSVLRSERTAAPALPHWRDGLARVPRRGSSDARAAAARDDRVADLVVQAALQEERGRACLERLRASRSCDRPLTASTCSAGVVREQLPSSVSKPFIPGIARSTSATSGCSRRRARSRAAPLLGGADDLDAVVVVEQRAERFEEHRLVVDEKHANRAFGRAYPERAASKRPGAVTRDRFSFPCFFAYRSPFLKIDETERDRDDGDDQERPDVGPGDARRRRRSPRGRRAARTSRARSSRSPASSRASPTRGSRRRRRRASSPARRSRAARPSPARSAAAPTSSSRSP